MFKKSTRLSDKIKEDGAFEVENGGGILRQAPKYYTNFKLFKT
jgi:hypothetical protein